MKKIKQGDEVAVLIGKDKGRRGTVLEILDNNKVLVEGINVVKKHTKANPNAGVEGGIIDINAYRYLKCDDLESRKKSSGPCWI